MWCRRLACGDMTKLQIKISLTPRSAINKRVPEPKSMESQLSLEKKIKCLRFLENFLDSHKVLTFFVIFAWKTHFLGNCWNPWFFSIFFWKKCGFEMVLNHFQTGLKSREGIKMKQRINTFWFTWSRTLLWLICWGSAVYVKNHAFFDLLVWLWGDFLKNGVSGYLKLIIKRPHCRNSSFDVWSAISKPSLCVI